MNKKPIHSSSNSFNVMNTASPLPGAVLNVPEQRWCLAPIPKTSSTLLKRVAVIAAGREPFEGAAIGETRPALAIHRAERHGLPAFSDLINEEQQRLLQDPHALRLGVTRHPGERCSSPSQRQQPVLLYSNNRHSKNKVQIVTSFPTYA